MKEPREIAPGIFWIGGCTETKALTKDVIHVHSSAYLITGGDDPLLFDTGNPRDWDLIERDLDTLLGKRPVRWLAPSHPELAHSGSLHRLLKKYPNAEVAGDIRDYTTFEPEFADRLHPFPVGARLDLGRGYAFVFLPALIKDLPSTQWGYEESQRVMFVADGFSYTHHPPMFDQPVHLPGECALMSSELPSKPSVEQAAFLTKAALYWTRYVDMAPIFVEFDKLIQRYPARLIAPSHGSVINNLDVVLPVIKEAHQLVRAGASPLPD